MSGNLPIDELLGRYLDEVAGDDDLASLQEQLLAGTETADALAELAGFELLIRSRLFEVHRHREISNLLDSLPFNEKHGAGQSFIVIEDELVVREEIALPRPFAAPELLPLMHDIPCSPLTIDPPTYAGPFGRLVGAYRGTVGFFYNELPLSLLITTVIMGLMLLGAWEYKIYHYQQQISETPTATASSSNKPDLKFVGRITGMHDCRWSDPQTQAYDGAAVSLGRKYALSSGRIEISYDTGVKVILEGPCRYEVESTAGGYLELGKLTARVGAGSGGRGTKDKKEKRGEKSEKSAANQKSEIKNQKFSNSQSLIPNPLFSVRTPTAVVTDLGTEFGVEVGRQGEVATHVFAGAVDVQVLPRGRSAGRSVRLGANESLRLSLGPGGEEVLLAWGAADTEIFPITPGQLSAHVAEERLKPFRRWLAHSQALRRDPSLLAYYDFQQKQAMPRVLPNVAAEGGSASDGLIYGATWTGGRMPGKHALCFRGPWDCVQIDLPRESDDLTVAAWVNIAALDGERLQGLLMSDGWNYPGAFHWQIFSDGRLKAAVRANTDDSGCSGFSRPLSDDLRPAGRWMFLAVVNDHVAGQMTFYIDERPVVVGCERQQQVPIRIGRARIANWDSTPWSADELPRNLRCKMDELAVFARALSGLEIKQMYEAGKPPLEQDGK